MSDDPREIECDEAIRMVLVYLDNELEKPDQHALEAHIHKCRACYTRVEFEKRLKGMVQEAPEVVAPDNLKDRIKKLTEKF